jgi:septal ring factor EnvC (AmiA/AmiB activator)
MSSAILPLPMRLLAALILLLAAGPAGAETCKYIDKEGRVTYSNVPVKNARKVTCFEPVAPAVAPPPAQAAGTTGAARVAPAAQRERDDQRRTILESELQAEEERLAQAKQALAEQEAVRHGDERNYQRVLDRLKPYQDAVDQAEKNVAAIRQELANLR